LEDVDILIVDGKLSSIQPLIPLLEVVAKERRRLLIIAENVDGDALSTLILNKLRGLQVRRRPFGRTVDANQRARARALGRCRQSARLWRQSQDELARFGAARACTRFVAARAHRGSTQAVLTGGTVISDEIGIKIDDATVEHLGRAKKARITADNTIIMDGAGSAAAIAERSDLIRQVSAKRTTAARRLRNG
jgi:chaperonin GroEL